MDTEKGKMERARITGIYFARPLKTEERNDVECPGGVCPINPPPEPESKPEG